MKIYLIRHGHAVEAEGSLRDDHRYLSQKGRQALRQVGRLLREQGVQLDAMLTSPLTRAAQTAEILADAIDYVDLIEALPVLCNGAPPRLVAQELPSRGVSVAVVGHMPSIAALGALLTSRPSFPPLRPGQVDLIEDGEARWFVNPDTMQVDRLLVA